MTEAAANPKVPRAIGPGWGRWLGRFVARVVWNTRVVGRENVPRSGPVIIAGNHAGWADGPLMIGCTPRGTHILVKVEMFRSAIGWIFRLSGQIPVDRRNGRPALVSALGVPSSNMASWNAGYLPCCAAASAIRAASALSGRRIGYSRITTLRSGLAATSLRTSATLWRQ